MRAHPVVAAAALVLVLSGCAPKPALEARWPRADSERTVSQPSREVAWPLTGKPALDAVSAGTPAVALPLAGGPAVALPGVESADVVYEISGGAEPRRVALFHSALPASAGPLRRAAAPDRALASAYRATTGEGAVRGVDTADVAALASEPATGAGAPPGMLFAAPSYVPVAATTAGGLRLALAPGTDVDWRFDKGAAAYVRTVAGKPAFAGPGTPIRATNVVVMWTVKPSDWPGNALAGAGRVSVFTAGRKVTGSWEATGGPPVFRDTAGAVVPLLPGNTWIQVVDNAANIVVR